jgi:hypothetical protein
MATRTAIEKPLRTMAARQELHLLHLGEDAVFEFFYFVLKLIKKL